MSNEIKTWWERLGCIRDPGANTVSEVARDAEIAELRAALASREAAAPQGARDRLLPTVIALDRIGMTFGADLATMEARTIKGVTYLPREAVMARLMQWRHEWDENSKARPNLRQPPSPAAPLVEMSEAQIDAIWDSLPGLTIIRGESQANWNRAMRRAFARAILAAQQPKE